MRFCRENTHLKKNAAFTIPHMWDVINVWSTCHTGCLMLCLCCDVWDHKVLTFFRHINAQPNYNVNWTWVMIVVTDSSLMVYWFLAHTNIARNQWTSEFNLSRCCDWPIETDRMLLKTKPLRPAQRFCCTNSIRLYVCDWSQRAVILPESSADEVEHWCDNHIITSCTETMHTRRQ